MYTIAVRHLPSVVGRLDAARVSHFPVLVFCGAYSPLVLLCVKLYLERLFVCQLVVLIRRHVNSCVQHTKYSTYNNV